MVKVGVETSGEDDGAVLGLRGGRVLHSYFRGL